MPDERHDRDLGGEPQPAGGNDADTPGAEKSTEGGAVTGHPGPGGGGGDDGRGDLGGDADLGGGAGTDEDPLRTQTAGGQDGP
jgi:hypothetical protein